jgi:AcrR family transcriptional regulator
VRVAIGDRDETTERPRRPKDRRVSILTVASSQFHRHGYAGTSLEVISSEVGISAPALYRHFRNKDELYAAALELNLQELETAIATATTVDDCLRALARVGVEFPTVGLLWNSDRRRRLADPDGSLDRRTVGATNELSTLLAHSMSPQLALTLARFVLAAISSTGYYESPLPADEIRQQLELILVAIANFRPSEGTVQVRVSPEDASNRPWKARRSALLDAGAALVLRQGGYNAITMEQIASEVGISPAAVYAEFPNKAALLAAALQRGVNWFSAAIQQAAAAASSAANALDRAVAAYLQLTIEHPSWTGPTLDELSNLPAEYLEPIAAAADDYLDEWLAICAALATTDPPELVRVRMRAALGVLDDRALAASSQDVLSVADMASLVRAIVHIS